MANLDFFDSLICLKGQCQEETPLLLQKTHLFALYHHDDSTWLCFCTRFFILFFIVAKQFYNSSTASHQAPIRIKTLRMCSLLAPGCYILETLKVIASRVDKMATEINRNMLCQFRILLLTHNRNFPILTPSKSNFLSFYRWIYVAYL